MNNSTKTDFQSGVDAMARSCLAAMTLLRDGRQTVGDVEQWLKAVIENDARYYDTARKAIAAAMLRPKPIHSHLHVDVKRGVITCGEHRSFVAKEIARKIESLLMSENETLRAELSRLRAENDEVRNAAPGAPDCKRDAR